MAAYGPWPPRLCFVSKSFEVGPQRLSFSNSEGWIEMTWAWGPHQRALCDAFEIQNDTMNCIASNRASLSKSLIVGHIQSEQFLCSILFECWISNGRYSLATDLCGWNHTEVFHHLRLCRDSGPVESVVTGSTHIRVIPNSVHPLLGLVEMPMIPNVPNPSKSRIKFQRQPETRRYKVCLFLRLSLDIYIIWYIYIC